MKKEDFALIMFFIAFCTIVVIITVSLYCESTIEDSETRIIEAIQKQNDSINAVQYLNRDERK